MGLSASKRVKTTLTNSPEFNSACDSAYAHCLSLTQKAFQGVLPYQLLTASDHIHATVSTTHKQPLIVKWVPSPPTRTQIDSALRIVARQQNNKSEEELILGPAQFKEWAVVLYAGAAVGNAGKAVLARVPIGVAGIVGIGAVMRSGFHLVGAAIGVYALGVATSIYLSLSG
ncbi:hypothetical protein P3X46_004553 [Hevea brasiliensis]|uniref:GDT1 family protein n=1 Tax=Hevea brasiliensis TaxID=3981 RepID=A0ABQ9N0R8_HEVBR|nr:uncharacterized protein LOC110634564 [Hevea brasiliensis]KAJ9184868.1 hypothetical protein P3X46_004553 [Hevea brasiliensis]